MNCIEKLRIYHREECEACIWHGQIIEFEQLPEDLKYEADYYDKDKDFLLYCEPCKEYRIIPSTK
jgi:hypothetical protein